MFDRSRFENTRPDGFPVLEVVEGPAPGEPPGRRLFVPLRRSEVTGEVAGPLADLRLVQVFGYSREACDAVLEAVYRFPLPGDAAVTAVTVRFGETEIRAALKEREQAEQEYEAAKAEGRQAALASRESPDVFTLRVAGLRPDEEVRVETSFVQLARPEDDGWSLRIPLTTAPRYVREDEREGRHAQGQPLALMRDPGHRFRLDLRFADAVPSSRTHALRVERAEGGDVEGGDAEGGAGARVQLEAGEVIPVRDCVLTWTPRRERESPALSVRLHTQGEHTYFLALVAPPAVPSAARAAREILLLVDHSGSMSGAKWEAADWAAELFLAGLQAGDTFNLCLFHDSSRWLHRKPVPADPDRVREAVRFLKEHRDSGGTNLGVALEQALQQHRGSGDRARHVLILTDAEVTDAGRLFGLVDAERKRADARRVSVLCVDAAPNAFLAHELADRGAGTARFLTSSPQEDDISTALEALLREWDAPLLTGLRLEVDRAGLEPGGRGVLPAGEEGGSALDLGDLPAGRPVWAAGRVPRGEQGSIRFRVAAGARRLAACRLPESGEFPALKALFGARRVLGLEFLVHSFASVPDLPDQLARLGYPAETLAGAGPSIYPENAHAVAFAALKPLLVRESLEYGIACSETAFIATRTERGEPVAGTVAVANALPSGWSDDFAARGAGGPRLMAAAAAPAAPMLTGLDALSQRPVPQGLQRVMMDAMRRFTSPSGGPNPGAPDTGAGGGGIDVPEFLRRRAAPGGAAQDYDAPKQYYSGTPRFQGGEAVLLDTANPASETLVQRLRYLTRLSLRFPGGAPDPAGVDPDLALWIYVEDLTSPRARVRVADLLQVGERPLSLARTAETPLRIVLVDPNGAWAAAPPELELYLR